MVINKFYSQVEGPSIRLEWPFCNDGLSVGNMP